MIDFLHQILHTSDWPLVVAFILGILTAIDPCSMAMNVTAIGYISKDIDNNKIVFRNGIFYTVGRIVGYTVPALVFIFIIKQGIDIKPVQNFFYLYGEKILGPFLLVTGGLMLWGMRKNHSCEHHHHEPKVSSVNIRKGWSSVAMGVIYALAFCPYTAMLYFGGLIPLSSSVSSGFLLPVVYGLATGLPVIIVAWILAFSVESIGKMFDKIHRFEHIFRILTGLLFVLIGLYYLYIGYIL